MTSSRENEVYDLYPNGPPYYGTFGRPARVQVYDGEGEVVDTTDYNIWYHRRASAGPREKVEAAKHRCVVARDGGETLARRREVPELCVFFARGVCRKGPECSRDHRIPTDDDERRLPPARDIFGRERTRGESSDGSGPGSFVRENRTLFFAGLRKIEDVDFERLLYENCLEWGEIDYVRVLDDRLCGFVRFKLRAAAEFALEAMHAQSLGYHEVLTVKWAHADPNPAAKEANARMDQKRARDIIHSRINSSSTIRQLSANDVQNAWKRLKPN